ncbi:MAG: YdcF family protein [Clostridia bacterium]|nr:YdcF family protein [Clostridia bacterium]
MRVSQIDESTLDDALVERLLFQGLEDNGEAGDCIIVLGSGKAMRNRVPTAVEAYKAGRAPKIMMCGGITSTTPGHTVSEADHMSLKAIDMGVPDADILVENTSTNTIENILCAMLVLQREMWLNKVKRVILVTASFHMRRSLHIARYFFPKHIEICPCPADHPQGWQEDEHMRGLVYAEAKNLIHYVQNGVMPDFDI